MRRLTASAALGLATMGVPAALASPALAAKVTPAADPGYGPNDQCDIALSKTVVDAGDEVQATGDCGEEGDDETFTSNSVSQVIGSVRAGPQGAFSVVLTVPANLRPGRHTITVTNFARNLAASAAFTVRATGGSGNGNGNGNGGGGSSGGGGAGGNGRAGAGNGGIAFTGTDTVLTMALGAGAICLGGLLVLSSRKRRKSDFQQDFNLS